MTKSESVLVDLVGVVLSGGMTVTAESDSEAGLAPGSLLRRLRLEAIAGAEGSSTCFPTELKRKGIFPSADVDFTPEVFTCFVGRVTGLTLLH